MAGFDFGVIGDIIGSVMDTDEIDIGRWGTVTKPDGSTAPISPETPLYEKVPCHISFNTTDNPDPAAVGSIPIIVSLTISCSVNVDLQNADTITVRKLSHDHQELEGYKGMIGAPMTVQSRKSAIMAVRQGA